MNGKGYKQGNDYIKIAPLYKNNGMYVVGQRVSYIEIARRVHECWHEKHARASLSLI